MTAVDGVPGERAARLASGPVDEMHVPGYQVLGLLGRGASGEVRRGVARATGVSVALKRIAVTDGRHREAIGREAAVLAVLDHPGLVRLHETVITPGGAVVLVLDLADGGSLAELLARRGRLTAGEVITALTPIAAALAHAHAHGVVHGDVSAANVLFTVEGRPMLADLGMSRLLDEGAGPQLGLAAFTTAYVDPLVAAGAAPDPASDVFALGALAFHALCGEPVWQSADPAEVAEAAVLGGPPRPAERLRAAGVPQAVADVVLRALSAEPVLRGSATDFALDLRFADEATPIVLRAGGASIPVAARGAALTQGVRPRSPLPPTLARKPGRIPLWCTRSKSAVWGRRRAVRPRPRHRRRARRPRALGPALVVLGLLLGAFAVVGAHSGAVTRTHDGPASSPSAPPGEPGVRSPDALTARGMLQRLDALRERAYAARDPALLAQVYLSTDLVERDSAQLRRLVPQGCALLGVRTDYGEPVVEYADAATVRLRVRAVLNASSLRCGASVVAHAAAAGPDVERIVLRREAGRYRIAALDR